MRLVYEYIVLFIIISILIMAIDAVFGDIAEFYNAWSWIISVTKFIHGQNPPTDSYIFNQ